MQNEIISLNQTIISTEVATMVEKTHANLMKDIRSYCKQLDESKIAQIDFKNNC